MKTFFALCLVFLIGCTKSRDETVMAESRTEVFPVGTLRENFADAPSIEKVTVKDEAGRIISQGLLQAEKKSGTWTEFDNAGQIKSTTSYVGGVKEGLQLEFSNTGQLTKQLLFHNNLKNGAYREFLYSNIKEERFYVNDKLEGTVRIFYDNLKPMEESSYRNGIRDGLSKWYDQDGNVSIQYTYKDGELVK